MTFTDFMAPGIIMTIVHSMALGSLQFWSFEKDIVCVRILSNPSGLIILSVFEFALGVPKRSSSDSSSEDTSAIGGWIMSLTEFELFLGASFFWGVIIKWFEVWLNNGRFLPNLKKK